ncbi:polysaccharide deacetylase family protein [Thermopolyspora sp. NPDC052614]|uniref:polysaccharide deacetylase family protein n=1 Tax=Thermopolyspora sp. NPDC052614 TaxID=3155682 RepID=UPI00341A45D6
MSTWRSLGGIASLVLLLTACDASVLPAAGDGIVVPSQPTVFDFVDPARIPGLGVETIAMDSPYVHVSYPTLADAPALDRGLRAWLSREVREHVAAVPKGSTATEFNVDWRLTAASGDIVGVRLRMGEFAADGWANGFRTLWYDRADGRLHPSADLVKPDAVAALATTVRRLATADRVGIAADLIEADPDVFDSLNFNRRGDLVVELDDSRIVPASMGRAAIAVPAADAAPLLSDLGRRIQATVRAAAPQATVPYPQARSPMQTDLEATGPEPTGQATGAEQTGAEQPAPGQETSGPAASASHGPGGVDEAGETSGPPTDCTKVKCVALTFDDGPGPYTAEILKIMKRHRACGTFFAVGINAAAQPDLVRRVGDGCGLLAAHTWSHRNLTTLPQSKIADQIERGRYAVASATGRSPTLLLPPYGDEDAQVDAVARELGVTVVRADVNAGDGDDPAAMAASVIARVSRNAIVLMHETRATVKALPRILNDLDRRGYAVVTVPDLGI